MFGSIVILVVEMLVLPATFCQLVLASPLVFCWSVQPWWSAGQERVRTPPLAVMVMFVGFGFTVETTAMEPSTAILLVQYICGKGSVGRLVATKSPANAWL